MSPAYYFVVNVNNGRSVGGWHVMRADGKTVCGRELALTGTFGGRVSLEQLKPFKPNLCTSCVRMKDADSMRLA